MRAHAAAEIDAVDDVAPLVRAAHLQVAAEAARQLDVVVGLQDHVVEFDERQFLLALEAQLHRIHRQHAVDREVPADLAQHLDVVELGQPLGIVDHHRVGFPRAEVDELVEGGADRCLVGVDLLVGEELARLVAAGRIADAGGAAAHQRDRLVAGRLQPVQHHDRQQMADMERGRRAVVADIGDGLQLRREGVEPGRVGNLVDEATGGQNVKKIGLICAHGPVAGLAGGVTGPASDSTKLNLPKAPKSP